MNIQESGEMYLETIYVLSQQQDLVRSLDVANYMDYSKPSVSRAVGILKKHGYLTVEENGHLALTETGLATAAKIYERHNVLSEMLIGLGVNEETAVEDACRIEHYISDESFDAIKKHLQSKEDGKA